MSGKTYSVTNGKIIGDKKTESVTTYSNWLLGAKILSDSHLLIVSAGFMLFYRICGPLIFLQIIISDQQFRHSFLPVSAGGRIGSLNRLDIKIPEQRPDLIHVVD
jgi:hypothetical protein